MAIDKEDLVKLSPQERIKKLKLMEEVRKKEVDEIEILIKESMQELKTDKLADDIAPEQRAVDISSLFESTGEQRLERTAKEAPLTALMKGSGGYQAFMQIYQDYSSLKKMMGYAAMGSLSEEKLPILDEIGERLDTTKYSGHVSAELAGILVASIATLKKIRKYAGI